MDIYQTAREHNDIFQKIRPTDQPPDRHVTIDSSKTFQEIIGFGGAFTEAASTTFDKLPEAEQEKILQDYFNPDKGHGYTLCRTHMNSCDFALGNYSCCETDGDMDLVNFSIDRELKSLIPMMHRAQAAAGQEIKLFISPWSPPAWMKTTGKMNQGGKLKPECRDAWALYYVRFIQALEKEGIPVWGLTIQNEPAATQTWDSCEYTAEEERDFIRDHLGPALHQAGLERIRVIIWDHNRDELPERAHTIYSDSEAAKYVWGAGFHWYGDPSFDHVQQVHDAWPDKQLIFTEGCQEGGPHHGLWDLGERYAESIIQDLNHWTVGWVDWNLLLDHTGGPNHVGNLCSAPLLANTETGTVDAQSSYAYIGHFSRFIKPGAHRVFSSSSNEDTECLAAVNPDGRLVVVLLNRTETALHTTLKTPEYQGSITLPPRSITTATT